MHSDAAVCPCDLTSLKDASFSDLYVGHRTVGPYFNNLKGSSTNPTPAPAGLTADIEQLLECCKECLPSLDVGTTADTDARFEYDGVAYRAALFPTLSGHLYVVRRMDPVEQTLESLGVSEPHRAILLDKNLRGLVLVAGQMSAGKSSTACAVLTDRTKLYGGVGFTAEHPMEKSIEGIHGPGLIFQTPVSKQTGGFGGALRRLVRGGGDKILLGEIRDADEASEAVRAGIAGTLVLATLHADSAPSALQRLHNLLCEHYSTDVAANLLADSVSVVMHQVLQPKRGGKGMYLEASLLQVRGVPAASAEVRRANFVKLGEELRIQTSRILSRTQ